MNDSDIDEKLRDILFKAAGGISGMADKEIAEIKQLFDQHYASIREEAEEKSWVHGQYYYLHQLKEAVAMGKNVFETIDRLETETRLRDRRNQLKASKREEKK